MRSIRQSIKKISYIHLQVVSDDFAQQSFRHIFIAMAWYGCLAAIRMGKADMGPLLPNFLETKIGDFFNQLLECYAGKGCHYTANSKSRIPIKELSLS